MLKAGTRYNLVSTLDESSPGHFIGNVYYERENVLGELQGDLFIYHMDIDFAGTPRFPNRVAGRLDGLEIVRTGDGVRFKLVEVESETA
ncbi:hypothetical protein [Pseudomonas sp. yb_9]|uniref:hypothetical protein n=1 Tax=Pseudomonas sp. yb_9 TaxID=3367222 RepID=UPI00370AAF81